MSKISLTPNAAGTGTFTIAAPGTNTDRTVNLPDAGGDMVLTTATQTLTNKTIQGGTITSGTAVTASGTSVDFTGIPSWVKRITVMFSGLSTNGTSNYQIQLGDSGGIETSGYAGGLATGGTFSAYSAGFIFNNNITAASSYHGAITLTQLNGNLWVATTACNAAASFGNGAGSGSKTLSDVLTQVRITTVNGTDTFDAGSINILYE